LLVGAPENHGGYGLDRAEILGAAEDVGCEPGHRMLLRFRDNVSILRNVTAL
jgi:hypothetical protein